MQQPLIVLSPWDLLHPSEPADMNQFGRRFLAEGDSWFSIGTLNPAKNSNLLFEMAFSKRWCAVNCAVPGDTLRRMVQMTRDPQFISLLCGPQAWEWDGLLLSAGGNDLISAVGVPPTEPDPARRLLRPQSEWGPLADGAARYLSDPGWGTFCTYLKANFDDLVKLRDAGPSKGKPIFIHTYACPVPREAGAGLGLGPWLLPSLVEYGIPAADRLEVARLLLGRLAALLIEIGNDTQRYPNVHVFDTSCLALDAALADNAGESGDWINEIHLTWRGYEKLAVPWAAAIEAAVGA